MKKLLLNFILVTILVFGSTSIIQAKSIRNVNNDSVQFLIIESGGALFIENVKYTAIYTENYSVKSGKAKFTSRSFYYYAKVYGDWQKPTFGYSYRPRHFLDGKEVKRFDWKRESSIYPPCDYLGYWENGTDRTYTLKNTKKLTGEYKFHLYCKGAQLPTKYTSKKVSLNVN